MQRRTGYLGGVNAYSQADYLIHAWHHFVLVKNDDQLLIYVDGELSGSSPSHLVPDSHPYQLILGRLHTLPWSYEARPWSGVLDEVALYDRALSSGEIKRHYKAGQ